jgi:hypothetical protein
MNYMKTTILTVCSAVILNLGLSAQNETIVVKAGTKAMDYFPVSERYRYPQFDTGQIVFRSGRTNSLMLNYNTATGEVEFIKSPDTLAIANSWKKEIRYVVMQDTFYYDKGYIEIISGGHIKLGLKAYVRFKDILKKGAMGTTARASSVDTYNSMYSSGNLYKLIPNEDIELERTNEYYLYTPDAGFTLLLRKNILKLFPDKDNEIKTYLKSHKVRFFSRDDLIGLTDFLRTL